MVPADALSLMTSRQGLTGALSPHLPSGHTAHAHSPELVFNHKAHSGPPALALTSFWLPSKPFLSDRLYLRLCDVPTVSGPQVACWGLAMLMCSTTLLQGHGKGRKCQGKPSHSHKLPLLSVPTSIFMSLLSHMLLEEVEGHRGCLPYHD